MNDFTTQMTWSSKAFVDLVWPVIQEPLGGGQIIPVEAVTKEEMRKHLDRLAGMLLPVWAEGRAARLRNA